MSERKKTVFISYCWKDGASYADELESQLKDYFEVFRDKSQLQANDDIYDFMGKVACCDYVVIVLTEEYVKSRNCMLEISTLANEPDWHEKAFVLVIDEKIYGIDRKLEILNYWLMQQKIAKGKDSAFDIGKSITEKEVEYVSIICDELEKILGEISRLKNPSQISIVNEVVRRSKSNAESNMNEIRRQEILKIIKENPDLTMVQIAARANFSMVSVVRILVELRKAGLIKITGSGNEKSTYCVVEK